MIPLYYVDVADSFIDHIKEAYASFRRSSVLNGDESDIYHRIRNENNWDRLLHIMNDIGNEHSGIYGDLQEANRSKLFFPLIMVKNPSSKSLAMSEEIFGPILPIIVVRSMKESVDYVKNLNSRRPTSLYVFSSEKKNIEKIVRSVIGVACSGDCHFYLSRNALSTGVVHVESDEGTIWSEEIIPSMCEVEDVLKVRSIVTPITSCGRRSMDDVKFCDVTTRFLFGLTMFMLSVGKSPPSFLIGLLFGIGLMNGDGKINENILKTSHAKDESA